MNTTIPQIPGYQINQYKIILLPHEELSTKIQGKRNLFTEKFGIEQAINSAPEVALVTFKQLTMNEERIKGRLRIIGMAMPAIKIEVKDFGSFPTHTIFLNITSKLPITNLVTKIRTDAQKLMKFDTDNKPHFMTDSFITIARKLKPWQYEKAWLEYQHKSFTGRFIAGSMLLLKRKEGDFKYRVLENFEFCNMPVDTKQGMLF
jgi:2'-5' RNA ligase